MLLRQNSTLFSSVRDCTLFSSVRDCTLFSYIHLYVIVTMNLFFINHWLNLLAKEHNDKHCVKMILEATQIAYSVHYKRTGVAPTVTTSAPYKLAHKNHPIVLWACRSSANYNYVLLYGIHLCIEYSYRYEKVHKCEAHLKGLFFFGFPPLQQPIALPENPKPTHFAYLDLPYGLSYIPLCMEEQYFIRDKKGHLLGVASYRNYVQSKSFKLTWKKRSVPSWYKVSVQ